jgi:predicted site-specific integrase-resolvase
MKQYKPGEFAKKVNRTINTLRAWDKSGKLPAKRTPAGQRYYTDEDFHLVLGISIPEAQRKVVLYARVSSHGQKKDLASQKTALEQFCASSGREIGLLLSDIGSGLNYKRKHFLVLMEMVEKGEVAELIIAHKDRLVRFGFEFFESFCERHNTKLTVMNAESLSPEQELTQDLMSVVHVFSSRLYGLRKYAKKIEQFANEQEKED